MSSSWHLHQSLFDQKSQANAFTSKDKVLSETGEQFLAGLLSHAKAATALATPTINGYKRYRPFSLAPDRILWGCDNRGAMLRVIGRPNDPNTHIENRTGEPAANPYLYFASQIYAGLDGMSNRLTPPPSADTPYEAKVDLIPRTLAEALDHLKEDQVLRDGFGATFIEYYCKLKEAELARFNVEVSEWEHREYFEIF
jgi:glutamine synthetase